MSRRVILYGGNLSPGGPKVHTPILARVWAQAGHHVTMLMTDNTSWPPELLQKVKALGVRVLGPPGWAWGKPALVKAPFLLSWGGPLRDADVVYVPGTGRAAERVFAKAPRAFKAYHAIADVEPGFTQIPLVKQADGVIVMGRTLAAGLATQAPHLNLRAMPLFSSDRPLPPPARPPYAGPPRVRFLGRAAANKRPAELAELWVALCASHPDLTAGGTLHLHGSGEAAVEARLTELARQHPAHIQFHGYFARDQLDDILAQTDLAVLPSDSGEGLPAVLFEALQRGVPIVSTPVGSIPDYRDAGPGAIVTQSTAMDEVAAAILEMLRRIRDRQIDPAALHRFAEDRYGFDGVAREYLRLVEDPHGFFNDSAAAPPSSRVFTVGHGSTGS